MEQNPESTTEEEEAHINLPAELKIVVIGEAACGKSTLINSYAQSGNVDFENYMPTMQETYVMEMKRTLTSQQIQQQQHPLVKAIVVDTSGSEDYDSLRKGSYNGANVVLICFSVTSPNSFRKIQTKWLVERENLFPKVPIILVGLKSDERNNKAIVQSLSSKGVAPITTSQGEKCAKEIQADVYVECSSMTHANAKVVFDEAITSGLIPKKTGLSKLFSSRKCLQLTEPTNFRSL